MLFFPRKTKAAFFGKRLFSLITSGGGTFGPTSRGSTDLSMVGAQRFHQQTDKIRFLAERLVIVQGKLERGPFLGRHPVEAIAVDVLRRVGSTL